MEKLVIFDLDGTLINTIFDISFYVNNTLVKYGYKKRKIKDIKRFIGNGSKRLIERSIGFYLPNDKVNDILHDYNKSYTESNSPRSKVFFGIKKTLKILKENGFKIAVLTNKPEMTTNTILNRCFNDIKFDIVVGQNNNIKCKPDPKAALDIINTLNADINNVYIVGDGETDVMLARNLNAKAIGVTWGYRSKEQLINAGCNVFAKKPSDIQKIILF